MNKIEVKNLQKKRKGFAVIDEISFTVHKSEIMALVGISNSGKTLVTKTILNLTHPNTGSIAIDGKNTMSGLGKAAKTLGTVTPVQSFYPETVYKIIKNSVNLNDNAITQEHINNILNVAGLKKVKDFNLTQLNDSQLARLRIAVATVSNPNVLILDEPFENLSPQEARHVRIILKTLADKMDAAILVTAKDLSGVEEICDTIAIIDNGMIVCVKSYNDLMRTNEPYTKVCVSTPTPNLTAMTIELALGYETNLCGADVVVDVHPDKAQLIYDVLNKNGITVFGMTKVNKSIQELFYNIVNRRRGGTNVLA